MCYISYSINIPSEALKQLGDAASLQKQVLGVDNEAVEETTEKVDFLHVMLTHQQQKGNALASRKTKGWRITVNSHLPKGWRICLFRCLLIHQLICSYLTMKNNRAKSVYKTSAFPCRFG